jgi:hypothetical protein
MNEEKYVYGTWRNGGFRIYPFADGAELRLRLDERGRAAWYCLDDEERESLEKADHILYIVDNARQRAEDELAFLNQWRLDYRSRGRPSGQKFE